MYSDSENSSFEYEPDCAACCSIGNRACDWQKRPTSNLRTALPFDPSALEGVILKICDEFDFRVILREDQARKAFMVTTGLSLAGSLIGRHYGGRFGAVLGGCVGGVCGVGLVMVSMRDIWERVKYKLSQLYDIAYDFLAGLGWDDYGDAVKYITSNTEGSTQLAMIILEVASDVLGKKIISSLTA